MEALTQADLCIGTASTASFQAALAGVPVIVLNLSGYAWEPPLDGASDVLVARSADELRAAVAAWREGTGPGGRDDLLAALGVDPGRHETDAVNASLRSSGAGVPEKPAARPMLSASAEATKGARCRWPHSSTEPQPGT